MLAAGDCSIVCLDEGYEGVSVPSKAYYALAAGAAMLAVTAEKTELADIVGEHPCGEHIPPGRPDLLAEVIRRYHDEPERLTEHQAESRRLAEVYYSRVPATRRYSELLTGLCWPGDEQPGRTRQNSTAKSIAGEDLQSNGRNQSRVEWR